MCGIAGALDARAATSAEALAETGRAMASRLAHRGPDDSAVWVDAAAGIALGHTRLAILDLTPDGAQPMRSADGRFVISYNGEIYNHLELRADLESRGLRLRGRSDTEVLLEAVSAWGVDEALRRANGMFAFALWDRDERRLTLARDRVGEKPLYYGWFGGTLLFASELKALRAHPAFVDALDRGALTLFLRYSYVTHPHCVYAGVRKLPPGTSLTVSAGGEHAAPRPYWSLRDVAADGLANPFDGDERRAVDELEALLKDAVRLRMCADVPLGAFLSGGIDSSTVVALMQAQSPRPVETFSIGFEEEAFDEARYAREVARHLGTSHHELYLTGGDALDVVPQLARIYDEPFADPSQIPTFLVSRFTRTHVTVSLSGDGGDELFAGYLRYRKAVALWRRLERVPGLARSLVAGLRGDGAAARLAARAVALAPGPLRARIGTAAELSAPRTFRALYQTLVSHWRERVVLGGAEPPTPFTDGALPEDPLDQAMLLDWLAYLPEDILTKVDRAAMAVSLESRVPLLDPRVVAFAWRLPHGMKQRGGETKWLLRQVLDRYVPRALVERPKRGFTAPIGDWLRGELRPWATDLLSAERLRREGLVDAALVEAKLREHLSGERDWSRPLWGVLVLEAWLDEQRANSNLRVRATPARSPHAAT